MTHLRRRRLSARLASAALAATALTAVTGAGSAPAASASSVPGPVVRLAAAQRTVTGITFRNVAYLDLGLWVSASRSPLEFQVARASYTKPVTITQIIRARHGVVRRKLPSWLLAADGAGLRKFLTVRFHNQAGQVVASQNVTFCPNSWNPARIDPGGPPTDPFPTVCQSNPFQLGMVWGVQNGWASDATQFMRLRLAAGTYQAVATIAPVYARLFHIPVKDTAVTVTVKLRKPRKGAVVPSRSSHQGLLPPAPKVPILHHVPRSIRPDLVPLPSWGISVVHSKKASQDVLTFGATVWVGGHSPLDVEGFRVHQSPTMKAYQYFWRGGKVIGRVRAGTMGFDNQFGHHHWHFQQFAAYRLLNSSKSLVIRSQKQGFCIAPTDAINLLLPHATWQPTWVGLGGQCGDPTAMWVSEVMPIGWGDTYFQYVAGQAFNITNVPNGTYYIEIIANPLKVLRETNTHNDVSLRKVILGGTPGHRTVKVPAWHGIDPEG